MSRQLQASLASVSAADRTLAQLQRSQGSKLEVEELERQLQDATHATTASMACEFQDLGCCHLSEYAQG